MGFKRRFYSADNFMVTRMGEQEISAISRRLQDNPRELARMQLANHRPIQALLNMSRYLLLGSQTENSACLQ